MKAQTQHPVRVISVGVDEIKGDVASITIEIGRGTESDEGVEHLFNLAGGGSSFGAYGVPNTVGKFFEVLGVPDDYRRRQIEIADRLRKEALAGYRRTRGI